MKKIFIHMGSPKTGTTSIQTFLSWNYDRLLEHNIFYPKVGRIFPEYQTGEFWINGEVLHHPEQLKQVIDDFEESGKDNLLLSEECLFQQNLENSFINNQDVLNILKGYSVTFVVYLRHAVSYLCSLWQESIKYRYQQDLLDFIESSDYADSLKYILALPDVFGDDCVKLRPFEPAQFYHNDIVFDFMKLLEMDAAHFNKKTSFENVSLSRQACEKILFINKMLNITPSDQDIYNINAVVGHNDQGIGVINSLSDDEIEKYSAKYIELENVLANKFLMQDQLFDNQYPKPYKQSRPLYKPEISAEDKHFLATYSSTIQLQILRNSLEEKIQAHSDKMQSYSEMILEKIENDKYSAKKDKTFRSLVRSCLNKILPATR